MSTKKGNIMYDFIFKSYFNDNRRVTFVEIYKHGNIIANGVGYQGKKDQDNKINGQRAAVKKALYRYFPGKDMKNYRWEIWNAWLARSKKTRNLVKNIEDLAHNYIKNRPVEKIKRATDIALNLSDADKKILRKMFKDWPAEDVFLYLTEHSEHIKTILENKNGNGKSGQKISEHNCHISRRFISK